MRKDLYVFALGAVLTIITGACHAQKSTPSTALAYSCVDAGGRRLTADRPIAACADREQLVTMPGGATRTLGPSYSEQERAERALQQRRAAEERYRANDGKRRERALAARYPTRQAHDEEHDEAIAALQDQIKIVQERKTAVLKEREQIDQEMEFYRKDPAKAPSALSARLGANRDELAALDGQVQAIHEDIKRTHQRFDEEAQVLSPYWAPVSAAHQ